MVETSKIRMLWNCSNLGYDHKTLRFWRVSLKLSGADSTWWTLRSSLRDRTQRCTVCKHTENCQNSNRLSFIWKFYPSQTTNVGKLLECVLWTSQWSPLKQNVTWRSAGGGIKLWHAAEWNPCSWQESTSWRLLHGMGGCSGNSVRWKREVGSNCI